METTATITPVKEKTVVEPKQKQETAIKGLINFKALLSGFAILTLLLGGARLYQQDYAWMYGLDSFHPDFQTYWMNLFYALVVAEVIAASAIWGWIWKTRDQNLDQLSPAKELKRIFNLVIWVGLYVYAVYWTASLFGEQDASWHQTIVRDTTFTPSHIILFYMSMPIYIIVGVASFLYGRTRIPMFARGISIPFLIGVAGPFLLLPNVGYNEWGHTFFIMEEIFSAPLHWGFVVLGWSGLALGGLLMQVVGRMIELTKVITQEA